MSKTFLLILLMLTPVLAMAGEPVCEEGFIANGAHSLFFKTLGEGDPIVVLHGGPGFDHRTFLPFIWELARGHQVILYDQRCTGLSTGPVDSASINIDTFIEDIEAVRKAFGIEKMNLLGHSMGGILAMNYSLRHPDKLKSLILCSTTATAECFPEMRDTYEANRAPGDLQQLMEIGESEGFQGGDPAQVEEFWRIYFKPYFKDQSLVAKMDLTFTENTIRNSNAVAGYLLSSMGDFDMHKDLKSLQCPTLIVHGDADPMDLKYAKRIHQSIAGSELMVVEGSGHWLFVDGTKAFSRGILGFLDSLKTSGAKSSAITDPGPEAMNEVQLYSASLAAHEKQDYATCLDLMAQGESMGSNHPALVLGLAGACALTGDIDRSFELLERHAAMGLYSDLEADEWLAPLRTDPRFTTQVTGTSSNLDHVANSEAPPPT